jgi:hypothetical protein
MQGNLTERPAMRLSEAIRLGATLGSQTRGAFFRKHGNEVATCALGAAVEAVGAKDKSRLLLSLEGCPVTNGRLSHTAWPILHALVTEQEVPRDLRTCRGWWHPNSLSWTIMTLNDVAGWTRTQIADWVEEFENRHAAEYGGDGSPSTADDLDPTDEPDDGMLALCAR